MKIAVYGATGMIGSRVVAEALSRGHEVVGVSRSGGGQPQAGVRTVRGDAGDSELTTGIAGEVDVVVSAIGPSRTGGVMREYLEQLRNIVQTLGGTRIVVVGGAGSLLVDGKPLLDHPAFPEIYHAEALIGAEALEYLRALGDGADWTFLSPAPVIQPGERTGTYNLGEDSPAGDSISAEDYAVALLDEIEKPAHRLRRFTVAH
ncbi:NAD(P)H-binding protein [Streptomyces sp. NPDC046909]|uniref:NAD(P)-dependent oxidoreductase n=1 Tax=Streptomyces sp. NPDC046909 TaxID=3155617 RepID=UPI0033D199E1